MLSLALNTDTKSGVLEGVWMQNVAKLEVKFEAPVAFDPTQLDPDLIAGNATIVPGGVPDDLVTSKLSKCTCM